jgi:pimeloyl-ACP methyl ester carboxylesterase
MTRLRQGRLELALHELRRGDGRPLLLLHGLGEQAPTTVPGAAVAWPGGVYALDFVGHGASTVPAGGGYTAEVLMADADAALAELGTATVVGRGLGAYIALLIAGARADLVHGAVLTDGPGLLGGGVGPSSIYLPPTSSWPEHPDTPDPFALAELSHDVRPADYAVE